MAKQRTAILREIFDNRAVLFGNFSETLRVETKMEKWQEICSKLTHIGLYDKDWKHLRDVTWQNLRRTTTAKRDRYNRTGNRKNYDEADLLILKILETYSFGFTEQKAETKPPKCKKSPQKASRGTKILSKRNSIGDHSPQSDNDAELFRDSTPESKPRLVGVKSEPRNVHVSRKYIPQRKQLRTKIAENTTEGYKKQKLKNLLLEEQLQVARRERYKLELEIFKLEKSLNVGPSEYTLELYRRIEGFEEPMEAELEETFIDVRAGRDSDKSENEF